MANWLSHRDQTSKKELKPFNSTAEVLLKVLKKKFICLKYCSRRRDILNNFIS